MNQSKVKILIVEDEVLIANQLKRKLEALDYDVLGMCTNGQEALRLASQSSPDLVLMDIVIQGEIDGIDTADLLMKEHKIPVIFLTAYSDGDTLDRAVNTSAYGYILKPFNQQEVNAMIRLALGRFQQERDLLKTLDSASQLSQALDSTFNKLVLQVNRSRETFREQDMVRALENGEFVVFYQPQISLADGQIVGAEALVRWQHPDLGLLYPGKFVEIAEENEFIHLLGSFVLEDACRNLRHWQQTLGRSIKLSVNVSVKQLHDINIINRFADIIDRTGCDPSLLTLELTESVLLHESAKEVARLNELKNLGLTLAIDDFGTGYSALSYLNKYPFDVIKIDRSFIHNISQNHEFLPIILAILRMAKDLGMTSVAEGVETSNELQFLMQNHCNTMQGFLFSPAVDSEHFTRLLEQNQQLDLGSGEKRIVDVERN